MGHSLQERLGEQPYQGYAYAYPHKTAYRHFECPIPLADLWAMEDRSALFLYVHLPFCEMRCGFCNLFTTSNPDNDRVGRYLAALAEQMKATADALQERGTNKIRFARGAFGGGTPSFLSPGELEQLFRRIHSAFGEDALQGSPISFEVSPATTSEEKLHLLRECGVTRISIGVQSFFPEETKALGRPQNMPVVHRALSAMRAAGFPVMNVDLIYGIPGQNEESWRASLADALRYTPEELYLYPLYIRPLTGLERLGREPGDNRQALYRAGRDLLLQNGYRQISMRLFRRIGVNSAPNREGPVYCCQEDGMLGLGAGARSYTRTVHYSSEYAVGRQGIESIIEEFSGRSQREHSYAFYGCHLSPEEERRRYVIKSLLRIDGLSSDAYRARFGSNPFEDFCELHQLVEYGLANPRGTCLILNEHGMERSDSIGPWLFSTTVAERMAAYQFA